MNNINYYIILNKSIIVSLNMNFVTILLLASSAIATKCSISNKCLYGSCCSKDGMCGTTSDFCNLNKIVPLNSPFECNSTISCLDLSDCCSQYGYCGKTKAYCETPVKKCSTNSPCAGNACCSQYGYCGNTPDYCNLKKIVPVSSKNQCNSTVNCMDSTMCCSKYGFCGNGIQYSLCPVPTTPMVPMTTMAPMAPMTTTGPMTTTTPMVPVSPNSPTLISLTDSNLYGIVSGGAVAIAASANVSTSVISTGAFNLGALGQFSGNTDSVGALALGANAVYTGNVLSQAAVTLGASAIFNGNIYSGSAVALGAGAKVNGNVDNVAAVTIGAGALISGTTSSILVLSSMNTAAIADIRSAYTTMMSLTNGVQLTSGTLLPGIYFNKEAYVLAAEDTITFNGSSLDTWIIQIIGAGTFSGNINLIGGASATNIRWVVSGAVSITANSVFYGSVFSLAALDTGAHSKVTGRLYSTDGACSVGEFATFVYA